jgi:hypothetical protein
MDRNPRSSRPRRAVALVAGCLIAALSAEPCTLAVFSGGATANGRPLMWKNRDTSDPNNKMAYFTGPKHAFVAVVIAEDAKAVEVWGGLNTAGFAIMNSQADDLNLVEKKYDGAGNGAFMKLALGECATVRDFEALLVREKGKWDLAANFGVIDAEGGACFFETHPNGYQKFDAADPRVAPFGYLVRTNFAFTSPDMLKGGGFIRFERIGHIVEAARDANRVDARFILQEASRDLVHEKLHSYPLTRPLPEDPSEPLYINTNDTINRNSSVSALLFQAPPAAERPDLATMWVILGQPVTGVAVPLWPAAGRVPAATTGPKTAPLNDFARSLVGYLYPDRRGRMPQYLNVNRLRGYGGEGVLAKLMRIENLTLDKAAARLAEWEKKKPAAEEIAAFQEALSDEALDGLRREFPGIR